MSDYAKIYERDGYRCPHCGHRATSVQHRMNRQMGGSRAPMRNAPSNLLAFCWAGNVDMEGNSETARDALAKGWKIPTTEDPKLVPYYDVMDNCWYLLDDDYMREPYYAPETEE
ncbi:hypothetical protein CQ010_01225 [Arthrobacter sp. MYb211]|uniref:hypothetical protein n=1 Tax=unclassified Arthrobacter TaxID=235627 RepID=UPI000CFCA78A|nr:MULTISPECIES: hypothetical protein [unclassified Arthrobacter]PRA13295.1 hypothetical protein CQ015_03480 [Arthrobacter sp. MYb221]PRC10492.1 hypothetical protein CQ010_01225 [Arthrobacter sp. MYb211]